jgi:hypothetical protein
VVIKRRRQGRIQRCAQLLELPPSIAAEWVDITGAQGRQDGASGVRKANTFGDELSPFTHASARILILYKALLTLLRKNPLS